MTITAQQINNHISGTIHGNINTVATRMRDTLAKLRADAENIPAPPSFTEHAAQAALNGEELDVAILDQITEHAEQQRNAEARIAAIASAHHNLTRLPQQVQRDKAPDTLAYLADTLHDFLADVAALDTAALPTNAEQALTMKDGAEKWEQMNSLVDTYTTIRQQQAKAYTATGEHGTGPLTNRSGQYRDALDTERVWLNARTDLARRASSSITRAGRAAVEFFNNVPNVQWDIIEGVFPKNAQSITDRLTYIKWVAEQTDAWVPSLDELRAADAENQQIVNLAYWTQGGTREPREV